MTSKSRITYYSAYCIRSYFIYINLSGNNGNSDGLVIFLFCFAAFFFILFQGNCLKIFSYL